MSTSPLKLVIQQLRTASERDGVGRTDGELLTRFLNQRDNDALAGLVERHAPMVWGVCRRILRNHHDAEDAFQATFIVLVRKAASVVPREMVGNWLYGVAYQTAVRLRAIAVKRGARETQVIEMPEPVVAEARGDDLLLLLDQELSCLPEKYRVMIVLCDLESKTRIEVARQLAIPEGTVASRLARARGMLAKRLARHGLVVSGGSLAAALSQTVASAGVPPVVVSSTIKLTTLLATGKAVSVISSPVATLTEGVLKAMFLKKIMTTTLMVLALSMAAITFGSLAKGQTEGADRPVNKPPMVGQEDKPPISEKPVEPAAKQEEAKEAFTAWGKEVGGVQAGIGFRPGERRVYHTGETVCLVLRMRNVGKKEVKLSYFKEFFWEKTPQVKDADGKLVPLEGIWLSGWPVLVERNLAPGKEVQLGEMQIKLEPANEIGRKTPVWTLFGTGKFQLQCENMGGGNIGTTEIKFDPVLSKLATGKLELEVNDAEKVPQKQEKQKEDFTTSDKAVNDLQGEWVVVAMEGGGEKVSAESLKGTKWVVRGNEITGNQPGASGKMSFKIDADKSPKEIVVTSLDGKTKGTTSPGIYSIDGHKLSVCLGEKVRPKQFATARGDGRTMLTLEKKAFTAWGKDDDLQAGLGFHLPGQNRVYRHGETVKLVVRVRNVGKTEAGVLYFEQFCNENLPAVTDSEGKPVPLNGVGFTGIPDPFGKRATSVGLKPGEEIELCQLNLELRPVSERGKGGPMSALYGTGKFQIQCENILGVNNLSTGKLELEVMEAEQPPQTGLPKPKVEKKKVYTPDEVLLEQEKARGKAIDGSKSNIMTVEFKVQAVTKPTEIKLNTEKDSPYVVGHGPDDMSLHPQAPKKFEERQFTVILTPKVVKQLIAVGIQDVGKHFMGKTIRVSGRINQHNYSGDDPPIEPHYDLVIEDIGQFEAVD
ncbi:MAG TPA: sigma-70 family RNA polymerase sigma factor [Gemmata sp.]|jgi:RNA polymerase sigma factor (sigma-70 family)|nr:sigma-70 family RNA polymerase sigma factor [Gemmata sp.]